MMATTADLRRIETFQDLPEDQLEWLTQHGQEMRLATGDDLFHEGDGADYMYVFLEGEVLLRRTSGPDGSRNITFSAGEISGLLPYSRLQAFQATGRAVVPTWVVRIHKRDFPEMMARMPVLAERLVNMMVDRTREFTRRDQQQEKLAALGKLSAGLAHELNNPAGAAKRAASSLKEVREQLRSAYLSLDCRELTTKQRGFIAKFEEVAIQRSASTPSVPSNSLERSDREDALLSWMEEHGVTEAYKFSGSLVDSCVTQEEMGELAEQVGIAALSDVLGRIHLVILASRLVGEIEQSTTRISELVKAIKDYTYMDQAPEQELDIHDGIESTLTILAYKFKKRSVQVIRDYDRAVPKVCAYGVELNQVWTNLLVNAIEAMKEGGELRIRTWAELKDVLVEIRDNGTGIPKEVQPRIFEPFFTTKGVGEGTGLGLDTVQRIVKKHRGQISLVSVPGDTRFTIRLPKQGVK